MLNRHRTSMAAMSLISGFKVGLGSEPDKFNGWLLKATRLEGIWCRLYLKLFIVVEELGAIVGGQFSLW